MNCTFRDDFDRDVKKLRNKTVQRAVVRVIAAVEQAGSLRDVPQVKAMQGHPSYYRIRIGHFRIGIYLDGTTADFVCCGHRREIYRVFP